MKQSWSLTVIFCLQANRRIGQQIKDLILLALIAIKGLSNNYIKVNDCNDVNSDRSYIMLYLSAMIIQKKNHQN